MAVNKTRIIGSVLKPDGTGHEGGLIRFTLSTDSGTTPDDTTSEVYSVGGEVVASIGSDGSVDFFLVPNDDITPSGTVWVAEYNLPGMSKFRELWTVATSGSSVYIGDVARSLASIDQRKFLIFNGDETALPAASSVYREVFAYIIGGAGQKDQLYLCMKDDLNGYDWVLQSAG